MKPHAKPVAGVAKGHGEAHATPTRVVAGVEGYGPKRAEARMLGRGGRPSERESRIAAARAEVARRKRDARSTTLKDVAIAVVQDERHLADDIHRSGWPDWRLFVAEVVPAE